MIEKELRKEINALKSKTEDEIDILEWRLSVEKILMKYDDKDEYFQDNELDKIKQKSKQEVDKINELIEIKEWNIMDDDAILKLEDYERYVMKELRIVKVELEKLKMSEERIEEIRLQYLMRL